MTPSKPKYVTYYRVSTERQGRSGLGLEAQRSAVATFLKHQDGREVATFTEVETGKRNDRPQLGAALKRCKQTNATLLVAKLDRLSRNAAFLLNLRDAGVKFQALDLPEVNTLALGVLAVIAQHERETISARTKAALAARKARGLPLGTPRDLSTWQAAGAATGCKTNSDKAREWALDQREVIESARAAGAKTLQAIADHLNGESITTRRGSHWTPAAVSRVVMHLGI